MSEIGLTEQFLASWSHCINKGEITYPEFEDYYEGNITESKRKQKFNQDAFFTLKMICFFHQIYE